MGDLPLHHYSHLFMLVLIFSFLGSMTRVTVMKLELLTPQRLKDEIRNHSTSASLFVINAVAWCSYYSEEGGQ